MGPAITIKTSVAALALFLAGTGLALAEPYQEVLSGCNETTFEGAKTRFLGTGWKDISNADTYETAIREIRFQNVRAKLSSGSYPTTWTDDTLSRTFSERVATSIEDLVAHEEQVIQSYLFEPEHVKIAVLEAESHEGILVLFGSTLQCWFSGIQQDNPTLVEHVIGTQRMRERGYGPVTKIIGDHRVRLTILSEHAQQTDVLFPINFDFTMAMHSSPSIIRSNE